MPQIRIQAYVLNTNDVTARYLTVELSEISPHWEDWQYWPHKVIVGSDARGLVYDRTATISEGVTYPVYLGLTVFGSTASWTIRVVISTFLGQVLLDRTTTINGERVQNLGTIRIGGQPPGDGVPPGAAGTIVSLTASPNPAVAGETVTLSIRVKNTGTQTTMYALMGHALGTCVNETGIMSLTLAAGEERTIEIQFAMHPCQHTQTVKLYAGSTLLDMKSVTIEISTDRPPQNGGNGGDDISKIIDKIMEEIMPPMMQMMGTMMMMQAMMGLVGSLAQVF